MIGPFASIFASICLHLVLVGFSLHQFHSDACYSTIFNRIHFQSFWCRCTLRHLWLQQKEPARAHRKGHQKVKERAQQQSRQNQSCLGSGVFCIFRERCWNSAASTIECLTWCVNLLCPGPCNDIVMSLIEPYWAFVFGTLRPVWVVSLVVVPIIFDVYQFFGSQMFAGCSSRRRAQRRSSARTKRGKSRGRRRGQRKCRGQLCGKVAHSCTFQ